MKSTSPPRVAVALSLLTLALLTVPGPAAGAGPGQAPAVDFARDVYPLLQRACFECHGPHKQKGGLRLDRPAAALRGGKRGPVIVPGQAAKSELYRRLPVSVRTSSWLAVC